MQARSSTRPRLLMLTHRFPYPPNRGDRIRSYNLIRVLSKEFNVTLGCTSDERVAETDHECVQKYCELVFVGELQRGQRILNALKSFSLGMSFTEGMFASPALARKINAWHRERPFDAVLVYCSSMFQYVDRKAFSDTQLVVDLVDVDSQKWSQMGRESGVWRNWLYRFESRRVRSLEQRIADRADAVTLVSDEETKLFAKSAAVSCPIVGISNGVDISYFMPVNLSLPGPLLPPLEVISHAADARRFGVNASDLQDVRVPRKFLAPAANSVTSLAAVARPLKLVFTGVLDYSPNVEGIVWFCRNILPALRREIDVELDIVGRRPHSRVGSLSSLPGVEVVGEVPDVRPYLQRADIAISPLKLARGIQNKVLEAMATGLPVVLTPQSAEGIDAQSGVQFVIADAADEWCEAIVWLAREPAARTAIGQAARGLVAAEYSWARRLSGFASLLKSHSPQ